MRAANALARLWVRSLSCVDPDSFARGGLTLTTFLVKGDRIQIALKMDHQRPVMAFRWRADDGQTLNAGLVDCSEDPDQYC